MPKPIPSFKFVFAAYAFSAKQQEDEPEGWINTPELVHKRLEESSDSPNQNDKSSKLSGETKTPKDEDPE
jgi:hypothetical protein